MRNTSTNFATRGEAIVPDTEKRETPSYQHLPISLDRLAPPRPSKPRPASLRLIRPRLDRRTVTSFSSRSLYWDLKHRAPSVGLGTEM
jgi:hypothetical protein